MLRKHILYLSIGILVFLGLAWYFSNIFIYLVVSIIIAAVLRPVVEFLSRIQFYRLSLPRALSVLLSFLLLIVVITGFTFLFVPLVSDQVSVLSEINYEYLFYQASGPIFTLEELLIEYNVLDIEKGYLVENLRNNILNFFSKTDYSSLINNIISYTGSFLVGLFAVIFITFFLLYEKGLIRKQIISLIPNQYFEVTIAAVFKIERLLSNYLLGLLLQVFSIFTIASVGLSLFGIRYALTIALFAALANIIPYAGPILGSTFGVIVTLSTNGFFMETEEILFLILKILSVFGFVQLIDNMVLQPLIFSKSVKAHPLEIFVIIFAGGTLGGIPGMIAAIPVYTIIRVSTIELFKGYRQYSVFKSRT
ncbi:MAG: AI-2E family transporter [Cyclobacteriaceae bacterium]|nr:AI-2E family transporter [Cyclobacteriaceae bacterium]MCH8516981.1 AI-2E family transporter [Cyclobacteriaceae bacterium]